MNYIEFNTDCGVGEKKIIGSIVNIAAFFHLGVPGIDVESVCLHGLASHNAKRFGAGTVRVLINLPLNHRFDTYEEDIQILLSYNKVGSLAEYAAIVEKSRCDPSVLIPRIKYPAQNLTGLLFDSGRIVLVGASNEYIARAGGALMVYMLHDKMKIPVRFCDFRVVNMVATVNVGFQVDLERFAESEGSLVKYSPHLFPAVIMPSTKKMTLLVNYTGNCILTGANRREDLCKFFEDNFELIKKYRVRGPEADVVVGSADKNLAMDVSSMFPVSMDFAPDLSNSSGAEFCRDLIAAKDNILRRISESSGIDIDDRALSMRFASSNQIVATNKIREKEACDQLFSIIDCIDCIDSVMGIGSGGELSERHSEAAANTRVPNLFNARFAEAARGKSEILGNDADLRRELSNLGPHKANK
jgi:transcription initiation factor TFIID TATA-box-binding protein